MSSDAELVGRADAHSVLLRAKLFRGLADPSRLFILEALRAGPLSVGEIVAITGLSQSNASNHLRCLSECGLVSGDQRGRFLPDADLPADARATGYANDGWELWFAPGDDVTRAYLVADGGRTVEAWPRDTEPPACA